MISCPAQDIDHELTSDVKKWRDIAQSLSNIMFYLHFCTSDA